jgi:hypothetical protein
LTDYFDFGPVSILLLEKLGGEYLPIGSPIPPDTMCVLFSLYNAFHFHVKLIPDLPTTSTEINNLYIELAQLGISHNDVRYFNIVSACSSATSSPASSGETETGDWNLSVVLSSLPSPFSGRTYSWRLIDFDRAEKSDWTPEKIKRSQDGWLERMLRELPHGMVLEPWD